MMTGPTTASFLKRDPHVGVKMSNEEQPLALVVVGNATTEGRIRSIMKHQGWRTEFCGDGDKAVDEYVRLQPDLVFLALDIPSMDGHIAALEMRETDYSARIAIVTSRLGAAKAGDAAYSAGAVGVLVTPLTQSVFDEQWEAMMGKIPPAPGLADLDELYPEIEEAEMPVLPFPPLMPPMPETVEIPSGVAPEPEPPAKKGGRGRKLLILLILAAAAIGAYVTMYGVPEDLPFEIPSL
ncbi:MAG: response regulator [Candidatus Poseidoniales archaeon]|nr:MAG: response regulator [Candidatus Poseidoniales archaeon]